MSSTSVERFAIPRLLTPRNEVITIEPGATLGEAYRLLAANRLGAIPIVDARGRYAGAITEGDILSSIASSEDTFAEHVRRWRVEDIPRRLKNVPVRIDATVEELLGRAASQSFVPVLDDREVFVGIVRRDAVLTAFRARLGEAAAAAAGPGGADTDEPVALHDGPAPEPPAR
jgi:CBS domain-containing protein